MYIVKTSGRACLLAVLLPLFVHGVLFAMALLGTQTQPPMIALPPPDWALGMLALRIAVDLAGLVIGHLVFRGLGIGSRAAYAGLGGLSAVCGYALSIQMGIMLLPPAEGAVVTAAILPVLAGMMTGFLYGQFAGRERLMREHAPAAAASFDHKPVSVQPSAAAFEGPVQVRTSMAAMFLTSFIPAVLVALLFFMLSYGLVSGVQEVPGEPLRFSWSRQIIALALPAQMFLTTAIVTVIPSAILVAIAHATARALRFTTGLGYAGAGALSGLAFGVVLIPFGGWPSFPFIGVGFLILPMVVAGAVMMAVYRRFAGLEPRSLPEAILATDVEALVSEHHPARRAHAVVLNG